MTYGPFHTPYRSQRDNRDRAAISCNVTALVMALEGAGIPLPELPPGVQPEDDLARVTETPEVRAVMAKVAPWAAEKNWPPRGEHTTLAHAANLWLGLEAVRFTYRSSLAQIAADLADGRPSVVTGWFTPGGHMVTLVGLETEQLLGAGMSAAEIDLARVSRFFVNDPWGNQRLGYKDWNGAMVQYRVEELHQLLCDAGAGTKWAHQIMRG